MTLILLALAAAVMTSIMVMVLRAPRATRLDIAGADDEAWLERARRLTDVAQQLAVDMSDAATARTITEFDDEELGAFARRLQDFCSDSAALTATAPTHMDGRVARNVGVRAQALGDVFDAERWFRDERPELVRPRATTSHHDTLDDHIQGFEHATRDLRTCVELL